MLTLKALIPGPSNFPRKSHPVQKTAVSVVLAAGRVERREGGWFGCAVVLIFSNIRVQTGLRCVIFVKLRGFTHHIVFVWPREAWYRYSKDLS